MGEGCKLGRLEREVARAEEGDDEAERQRRAGGEPPAGRSAPPPVPISRAPDPDRAPHPEERRNAQIHERDDREGPERSAFVRKPAGQIFDRGQDQSGEDGAVHPIRDGQRKMPGPVALEIIPAAILLVPGEHFLVILRLVVNIGVEDERLVALLIFAAVADRPYRPDRGEAEDEADRKADMGDDDRAVVERVRPRMPGEESARPGHEQQEGDRAAERDPGDPVVDQALQEQDVQAPGERIADGDRRRRRSRHVDQLRRVEIVHEIPPPGSLANQGVEKRGCLSSTRWARFGGVLRYAGSTGSPATQDERE